MNRDVALAAQAAQMAGFDYVDPAAAGEGDARGLIDRAFGVLATYQHHTRRAGMSQTVHLTARCRPPPPSATRSVSIFAC